MLEPVSRRDLLKQFGSAAFAGTVLRQSKPILVAGNPVEIAVATVSPATVRITVLPVGGRTALADDGALVEAAAGRTLGRQQSDASSIRAGDLVVRCTSEPPAIAIETAAGQLVQRLTLEQSTGGIS